MILDGLLESGDALTRAMVEDYLNHLMRKVGQAEPKVFSWPLLSGAVDAKGKPKKARYHSTIDLQGHPADSFRNDLMSGRLTGIDLIKTLPDGVGAGGESPYVRQAGLITRLASRTSWKDNPLETLAASIGLARDARHDTVRVRFNSADRMAHSVEIDPVTENVMGDSFVKKLRIGPFTTLKTLSCREFDPDILRPMIGLLNSHRSGIGQAISLENFIADLEVADHDLVPDASTVLLSDDQEREQDGL